jgi:hypothetical protein
MFISGDISLIGTCSFLQVEKQPRRLEVKTGSNELNQQRMTWI